MRTIRRHIIHASATPNTRDHTAADIDRWHRERGFLMIGYHFVIRRDGKLEMGRPLDMVGSHVKGHNHDSIGTCLIGAGVAMGDFTPAQMRTLRVLDMLLRMALPIVSTHGHREFDTGKTCPGFEMREMAWTVPAAEAQDNLWHDLRGVLGLDAPLDVQV